jgi:very-short-patch-repair endonuclease
VDAEGGRGVPHSKIIHWKSLPYNPKLKEKAKKLRKDGNLAEVLFWQKVKNNNSSGWILIGKKLLAITL